MFRPGDIPRVLPYERYTCDCVQRARWVCPRCQGDNSHPVLPDDCTLCVCRVCRLTANVEPKPGRLRRRWRYGLVYQVFETAEGEDTRGNY